MVAIIEGIYIVGVDVPLDPGSDKLSVGWTIILLRGAKKFWCLNFFGGLDSAPRVFVVAKY